MNVVDGASQLPQKELSLFKRIVKSYEHKQYKTGLKFSKVILSNPKYSEHGETLSMKGLILNCVGKKEEAFNCCKKGLQRNLKSSICWHVYGLLQKSDRKYDEAIKCYVQALRLDKENMQILRDLSLLQMQMRDLEGYKDTRYQLLLLRPSQKASWIGYAMAHHMLVNYDTALSVLEEFRKAQQQVKPYDYEHSEVHLYIVKIMMEGHKYNEAITHLDKYSNEIVDRQAFLEMRGELMLLTGKYEEAKKIFWELIDRNEENVLYYEKLEEAMQISTSEERLQFCKSVQEEYPQSSMPKKLPLGFLTGDAFLHHADSYLKRALQKGVPPLFVQLQFLYSDPQKVTVLESLILGYKSCLEAHGHLNEGEESDSNPFEPPSTLIWTNYLLAQHYSFMGKTKEALDLVDEQLEHTPTLIEFYALKGQINRDAGDLWTASLWLEEAQSLDTADRYINSQCTRYLIQAGRTKEAEEMAAKFTREGASSVEHLNEMQCMWFLTESAKAFREMGKYGEALKKCHEVERHFMVVLEDQFDFHSYCLRKMTLRAYTDMLRLEDKLRSHPFYFDAAKTAIEIYLHLHEHPLGDEDSLDDAETKNLSASELRKLRNKQRKAKKKAENEAARHKVEQDKRDLAMRSKHQTEKDPENERPNEEKLDPSKLSRPENPLEEAKNFLKYLIDLSPDRIETHCLAYEVYERKEKPLLMLRSIKRGNELAGGPEHPWFHQCRVRFMLFLTNNGASLSPVVRQVVDAQMPGIYGEATLTADQLNDGFMEKFPNSLPHLFSGAIVRYKIHSNRQNECVNMVTTFDLTTPGTTWRTCKEVAESLKSGVFGGQPPSVVEAYRAKCQEFFPFCIAFLPADALQERLSARPQVGKQQPAECNGPETSSGDVSVAVNGVSCPGASDAAQS